MRFVLAALAAFFIAGSALAQTAVTVAASSAQMVAASTRESLSICNQSATASISYCFADTSGSCTAALNTAGQYMVAPGQCSTWRPGERPPGVAIFGIASAGSTPVTVSSR
jgi:hypothetical protein